MSRLSYYEQLIQEKRKKTPFREFIKELGSWEVMNLYKRGGRICRYPENNRVKKLGDTFWEDAPSFGRDYNFTKSFFQNFLLLQDTVPMQYKLQFGANENCDYMDSVFLGKNVYLSFIIGFHAENVLYSAISYINIKNVINSCLVTKGSSEIANSHGVSESYKVFYSKNIVNSSNIYFSTNLIGCEECIGCDNLENQKYQINNVQYSQDEYEAKKKEILHDKKSFDSIWKHIQTRPIRSFASDNVSGVGVTKSSDITNGLWVSNTHTGRNLAMVTGDLGSKNFYDCIEAGVNASDFYGVMGSGGPDSHDVYLSYQLDNSSFMYYSAYVQNCHHCLGCIGLKNKSYCILNKQYTKEEWEVLAEKIFASMEADGTLGEFFPATMNPFYFNDTLAYLIDGSFTKEEVEAEGYLWRDTPIKVDIPEGLEVVKSSELGKYEEWTSPQPSPKGEGARGLCVWHIDPAILDKVIIDEKGNYYRIVQMEYDFLMKHALPLPRMHWLDRIKMGFRG